MSLGPYFRAHSAHFGIGFFPTLAWIITVPLLAVVLSVVTLVHVRRQVRSERARRELGRTALWLLTAALYVTVAIAKGGEAP